MSKHLSEPKKKNPPRRQGKSLRGLEVLRIYPDNGADSEGYPAGWRIPVFLLSAVLLLLVSLFFGRGTPVRLVLGALSFCLSAFHIVLNLMINFRGGRFLCEALPVLVAAVIGFCTGLIISSVLILMLYQLLKLLEIFAVRHQQESGQPILGILPQSATLIEEEGDDRTLRKIKPVHIRAGDRLLVQPGEIIPVDALVEDGVSSVDLGPLIRGKKIVPVAPGRKVFCGCRNLTVPLTVCASANFNTSAAPRVYSSFTATIRKESEDERLFVRVSNILYPVLLVLALLFGLLVPLFTKNWIAGARQAMVFLLAACPFAMENALSLAVFSGVSEIFSAGILIREIRVLFSLAKLETFICNKTCTVTESYYSVRSVNPSGISDDALLAVLAKAESRSSHPIARAIRKYAGVPDGYSVKDFSCEEIPCKGISARIGETEVLAGNATLLFDRGINCSVPEGQGIAIHAAVDGKYCGYIVLENTVREGNYDAIEQMRALGVKNFALLSGDLRSVVRPIASALNFNVVKAELTPEGKANAAAYLSSNRTQGKTLAYAGDGSHEMACVPPDSLSVTTGALGDGEASRADIVILGESFVRLPAAVHAGRASSRLSFLSVVVHFSLRLLLILLALLGVCPPLLASVLLTAAAGASFLFASWFFSRL